MHPELVDITPYQALFYSFLLGLLHGIIPDEHTWPITFSYTLGGGGGKAGFRSGLYFSIAFTVQRMMLSQVAYLALAPFLLSPRIDGYVYTVVGILMAIAGFIVIWRNRHVHAQLHRETGIEPATRLKPSAPPAHWTFVHGFAAGFGFDALSIYVNTVAVTAMPGPWAGSFPGLLFGLGTTISLVTISRLFGTFIQKALSLTQVQIKVTGALSAGRILFFGGILFAAFGIIGLSGFNILSGESGYVLIGIFLFIVAIPVFVFTFREVKT